MRSGCFAVFFIKSCATRACSVPHRRLQEFSAGHLGSCSRSTILSAAPLITMGIIRTPKPVKLFVGMLSSDPALFETCGRALSAEYGPVDYESAQWRWDFSEYYRQELGSGLLRKFLFFERLLDPALLASIKRFTNDLEKRHSAPSETGGRRRINLDPGYLTEAKVVLATTKDYAHRVYIGNGIYAEVTLRYQDGRFTALDTTYPDYRTEDSMKLFEKARALLRAAASR